MEHAKYRFSKYNLIADKADNAVIIFNQMTGQFFKADRALYGKLTDTEVFEYDSSLKKLADTGIIIPDNKIELLELLNNRRMLLTTENAPSVTYVIAPTLACNMRCVYCFENCTEEKKTMSDVELNKVYSYITDQLLRLKQCRRVNLTWFGGEPTLMIDKIVSFMEQFNAFCSDRNISLNTIFVTNGLLLSRENAQKLVAVGIEKTQITIDGMPETYARQKRCNTKDFYTVVQNIKDTCDILKIAVRINVNKRNAEETERLYDFLLKEQGLADKITIYAARIVNYDGGYDPTEIGQLDFERFRRKLYLQYIEEGYINSLPHNPPARRNLFCGQNAKVSASFGPDGHIYRCEQCIGDEAKAVGSLDAGLFENELDYQFRQPKLPSKCMKCNYLPACMHGCMANNLIKGFVIDCEAVKYALETDLLCCVEYLKKKNKTDKENEHA